MKSKNYSKTYFSDLKHSEKESFEDFNKLRKPTTSSDVCEKSMYNDKYLPQFLLDEENSEIFSKHTADYEIHEARENDDAFDFTAIEKSIEDFKTENSISNPFSSDNEVLSILILLNLVLSSSLRPIIERKLWKF